jgi:hypothetical protein
VEDPDHDPMAPLVAAFVLGTILALVVLFITITGAIISVQTAWHYIVLIGPWWFGGGGTLMLARWIVRRKRT